MFDFAMEKLRLNNEIVSMRRSVRKAQVHVIHKLTREINRLKNRKGGEKQVEKCKRKAERLKDELTSIKKIKLDDVSKFAIKNTRTLEEILTYPQSPCFERALGRLACHPEVLSHIQKLRAEPVDWVALLDDLGSRTREKKKKNKKLKGSKESETHEPGRYVRIKRSSSDEDIASELLNKNNSSEGDSGTECSEQYTGDHSAETDCVTPVKNTGNSKRRKDRQSNIFQQPEEDIDSNSFSVSREFVDSSDGNSEHSSAGNSEHSSGGEMVEKLSPEKINSLIPDPFFLTDEGEYLSSIVKDDTPDDDKSAMHKTGNSNDRSSKASERMKRNHKGGGSFRNGVDNKRQERRPFRPVSETKRPNKSDRKTLRGGDTRGKLVMKLQNPLNEPPVSLHPSWEAKKKLQQQQLNIHTFQGKKITFTDNE